MKNGMKRAFFHFLGGLVFPVVYYFTSQRTVLTGSLIALTAVLLFEWVRKKYPALNEWLFTHGNGFFKEKERAGFTGMPFFILGALLTVFLYDKPLAITALCFLTFGDVTAAVVGKRFGKNKIFAPKSLEGSLAFFLVTALVGLILRNYFFLQALSFVSIFIAAFTATLIETLSASLDDNLTVPILTGFVLQILRF